MKPAALIAFVVALGLSSSVCAQGAGLRLGAAGVSSDAGWWIAPTLNAPLNFSALDFSARGLGYQSGAKSFNLSGMVEPRNAIAPYLGIAYGSVAGARVNFYFDLGVIYRGSPNATPSSACTASMAAALCPPFQSDAPAGNSGLERSLDKYNLYPVGQVRVTIGF